MSSEKRVFLVVAALAVVLVVMSALFRSNAADERAALPAQVVQDTAPALHAAPVLPMAASVAGRGAPVEPEPVVRNEEPAAVSAECLACREKECTNYQQSGVDLLGGCFKAVDPSQGADIKDAQFLEDCAAVVRCAARTHCADAKIGAAACYCGASLTVDECVEHGPGRDAPCLEEWRRAARSTKHEEVAERFSDFKYPSGWASAMVDCDRVQCRSQCSG